MDCENTSGALLGKAREKDEDERENRHENEGDRKGEREREGGRGRGREGWIAWEQRYERMTLSPPGLAVLQTHAEVPPHSPQCVLFTLNFVVVESSQIAIPLHVSQNTRKQRRMDKGKKEMRDGRKEGWLAGGN